MIRHLGLCLLLALGLALAVSAALAQLSLPRPETLPAPAASGALALAANPADRLTGLWHGKYFYGAARTTVTFELDLRATNGKLEGRITEPNTFGDPAVKVLFADVVGNYRSDGRLTFTKTYDGTGEVSHSVTYSGLLTGNRVKGIWTIGSTHGDFELWR